jgi:hypothetical protein
MKLALGVTGIPAASADDVLKEARSSDHSQRKAFEVVLSIGLSAATVSAPFSPHTILRAVDAVFTALCFVVVWGRRVRGGHPERTTELPASLKTLARFGIRSRVAMPRFAQERVTLSMMIRSARLRVWRSSLVRPLKRRASNSRT